MSPIILHYLQLSAGGCPQLSDRWQDVPNYLQVDAPNYLTDGRMFPIISLGGPPLSLSAAISLDA